MTAFILPISDPAAIDPEQVGPKAANLASLTQGGLPTPGGFALTAEAYHHQLRHLGVADLLAQYNDADRQSSRKMSVAIRLALYQQPIAPEILEPLLTAWRALRAAGTSGVVRSSALIEDRKGANFAGQFESFLGLTDETEFLTAVRACWAALWTSHARRYMENHELSPADTAMGVLIQPLISARASGGGLSETADGQMLISATWGLGSAIAQGEVVPDRVVLAKNGFLRTVEAGRKSHRDTCDHGESAPQLVPDDLVNEPCLSPGEAVTLGRLLRKCEQLAGQPVEIEWAMDEAGFKLLQSRPLHVEPATVPDEIWLQHPGINGHPAGIGWGSGKRGGGELRMRIGPRRPGRHPGDARGGPGAQPDPAAGRRRGGRARRLHLASCLARARARHSHGSRRARRHPQDSRRRAMRGRRCRRRRAVAAMSGKPRVFITQPIAQSALDRLRTIADVKMNPDSSKILARSKLLAAVKKCDILFSLLHDTVDRAVLAANPKLKAVAAMNITPDRIDYG